MENVNKTKAQVETLLALAEAIKTLKQVPNGELYARLMDRFSLEAYNSYINALVAMKAVEIKNNVLIWKGV